MTTLTVCFSTYWKSIVLWIVSLWLSLMILVFAPPIAAGFIGVPFVSHVENPYCKIIIGFIVTLAAYFLIVNVAEVAVVLTAIQTKKVVLHFMDRVQENIPGNEPEAGFDENIGFQY